MMITTKLVGVAALALTAAPLAVAAPAQATVSKDGCTLTALDPYFAGTHDPQNRPEVFYPYEVTCAASWAAKKVTVDLQTWEQDLAGRNGDVDQDGVNNADDEHIGNAAPIVKFGKAGGTKSLKVKGVLFDTDTDDSEEMYSKIRFKVKSGSVSGNYSGWDLSQASRIFF